MQEAIKDGEPTRLSVFFMSFEPASVMHIYSTSVMQFCKTIDKFGPAHRSRLLTDVNGFKKLHHAG